MSCAPKCRIVSKLSIIIVEFYQSFCISCICSFPLLKLTVHQILFHSQRREQQWKVQRSQLVMLWVWLVGAASMLAESGGIVRVRLGVFDLERVGVVVGEICCASSAA